MGHPGEKLHRASYADLEAVPAHKVAQIINGELRVMPRPAPKHAHASTSLTGEIVGPFQRGRGGPGGWRILDEPELHFGPNHALDILVPDLAGLRIARMPELPSESFFRLAPDWICEVLSPSTEDEDRDEKMPIYAREGVRYAWLLDPIARTLEAFELTARRRWGKAKVYEGGASVRVAPFEAVELELAALWG